MDDATLIPCSKPPNFFGNVPLTWAELKAEIAALPSGPVAWNDVEDKPLFGSASLASTGDFATEAEGTLAGTAVQPAALTAGLAGKQAVGSYASGAQGALADTAVQPATMTAALAAKANVAAASAFPATTGTVALVMGDGVRTCTPTGNITVNASGGVIGDRCTLAFTTTGTTSRTITFGTNMRKTGTLATGTVAARFFSVTFVNIDGTIWQEESRTIVQT